VLFKVTINFGPALSQKLSLEFTNHHVPLRVATVNSLSKEPKECDSQTAGHRIGAQQETGITGKKNHPASEILSNNEVGALQNLESGTAFSPLKKHRMAIKKLRSQLNYIWPLELEGSQHLPMARKMHGMVQIGIVVGTSVTVEARLIL
jgi:hypothetical protein